MTTNAQQFQWSGVMPAITTPMHSNGEIAVDAAVSHAEWMIASGCDGVVIGGSLGEGQALSTDEKIRLWNMVSAALHGRAPVIAAIGSASTLDACALARRAADAGCAGLMVLPPYVHSGDQREALAHIAATACATNLPVMVYNNPQAYRADLSADALATLANRHANIRAVKDSTGDPQRIAQLVALTRTGHAPTDLAVFVGLDDVVPAGVAAGAQGWIAGLANALPAESVMLWKLAIAQRSGAPIGTITAEQLDRAFLPLLRMDTVGDFVQRIKIVQAFVGRGSESVRAPRLELDASAHAACLAIIRSVLIEFDRLGILAQNRRIRSILTEARND